MNNQNPGSLILHSPMDLTAKVEELKKQKFNILLPVTEFASRSELFVPRIDIVVPQGVNGGDFYEQSSKKTGEADNNGKDIWAKPQAPTAQLLHKIASAANIQWHPDKSGHTVIDRSRVVYKAVAAIRQADGQYRIIADEYELDLEVIEDELRMEYEKKAKFKDFQEKMAKERNDLEYYIKRDLLQKRKFKTQLAATGAMNRVIRKALTLKNAYWPQEAVKPFAIARFDFQPDYSDPTVRRYASVAAVQAQNALFGQGSLTMPENVTPKETQAAENFMNQGAGTIDANTEGIPWEEPPASYVYDEEEPTVEEGGATQEQLACHDCGQIIDQAVHDYAVKWFKRPLCRECQQAAKAAKAGAAK